MICSPAAKHGVFLKGAEARNRFSRVKNPCVCALDGVDELPGMGRDPAQVLHQVQNHALAAQQHARIMPHNGQHLSVTHAHAVEDLRMADDLKAILRLGASIESREDLEELRHASKPGHDHLLPRDDRGRGAQVGIDGEIRRGIAVGLVFHQGVLQQCFNAVTLPIHSF